MIGDSPPMPIGFRESNALCSFAGAATTITGPASVFTNVSAGDPLYICDVGNGAAIVGMYRVETKTDTENLVLDRNGASAAATGVTAAFVPHDGTAEDGTYVPSDHGPFPSIKYALDGQLTAGDTLWIKAGSGWTLDNIDQQASTIDVTSGGVVLNNTRVSVKGYYETIGDMCPGGAYHGTPMDTLLDSLSLSMLNPNAKWVDIDGDGLGDHLIGIADNNIFFHNFSIHGTTGSHYGIITSSAVVGGGAINCVIDDVHVAFYCPPSSYGVLLKDCSIGLNIDVRATGYLIGMRGSGCLVLNNIAKAVSGRAHLRVGSAGADEIYGGAAIGNLFIGGTHSQGYAIGVVWKNNTFWDCENTSSPALAGAINVVAGSGGQDPLSFVFSNIMSPKYITGYGIKIDSGKGSVNINDNNLMYSQTAGAVLTNKYGSGGNTITDGTGILEVDPHLSENVYEPQNHLVLSGGLPDITGSATGMGARLPEFIRRSIRRIRYHVGSFIYKW